MVNPTNDYKSFAISKNFVINTNRGEVIDRRDLKHLKRYEYNKQDTKILIYEDRMQGWFFDIAEKLKNNNEAGFVVLMIATSYFEANQQMREGRRSTNRESTSMINDALRRIFPELSSEQRRIIIEDVRQGFFHDGIARQRVFINASQRNTFEFQAGNRHVTINPHLFFDRVKKDFEDYIVFLKDKTNHFDRNNFEKFWNSFKGL